MDRKSVLAALALGLMLCLGACGIRPAAPAASAAPTAARETVRPTDALDSALEPGSVTDGNGVIGDEPGEYHSPAPTADREDQDVREDSQDGRSAGQDDGSGEAQDHLTAGDDLRDAAGHAGEAAGSLGDAVEKGLEDAKDAARTGN